MLLKGAVRRGYGGNAWKTSTISYAPSICVATALLAGCGGGGGFYGGGGGGAGSSYVTYGYGAGGGRGGGSSFVEKPASYTKEKRGGAEPGNRQIVISW